MNIKRLFVLIGTVLIGLTLVSVWMMFLSAPPETARAANYTVCLAGPPTCDYSSIQAAIDVAGNGDTLDLAGDTFTESITVDKSLTISGVDAETTIVQSATEPGVAEARVVNIPEGVTVTITGLTIRHGKAETGMFEISFCGGIDNDGSLTLSETIIEKNQANENGGGICNTGTMTITNSIISENSVGGGSGGGIVNGGTITLTNVTINNNSAGSGAGISNGGIATINNSTIINNSSHGGSGGIHNNGTIFLEDTTISGNIAKSGDGGGINNGGNSNLKNVTITNNSVIGCNGNGGGIYTSGYITITNTILAGNHDTGDIIRPDCSITNDAVVVSNGYNLVGVVDDSINNWGCNWVDATGDLKGTFDEPLNPGLGPLQDNGSLNFTHAPHAGSPAVDAGSCADDSTDQRGYPRPVDMSTISNIDDGCDIGAHELQTLISLDSITPNSAAPNTGDLPVTISGFFLSTPDSVQLGGVSLLNPSLVSSTTLNAVVPIDSLEVDLYDLIVTGNGESATLPKAFMVGDTVPYLVKDIGPFSSNPNFFTVVNGTLFFVAYDGGYSACYGHGTELWKSDGTEAGTVLVKDILPGTGSSIHQNKFTNANGILFFSANDGIHGEELWKSDGTEAGTVLVKDINPGSGDSWLGEVTSVNDILYFVLDGELWKSDGTEAGTTIVKDIIPGAGGSYPSRLTNVDDTLFFTAWDDSDGGELWKSDGTEAGTVIVKDINPGSDGSSLEWLTNVNGTLFFVADDGVHGEELWKSDGTETGTVMVKDVILGAEGSGPVDLTGMNSTLYFAADDGVHGEELWKSDGTEVGTVLVKDICSGSEGHGPGGLTNVDSILYFVANDCIHGEEIWKSDGTEAGTMLVKDIYTGGEEWGPGQLTNVNGTLFFETNDGIHGEELWKSDGTEAGTVMVKDINPGNDYSWLGELTSINNMLFFHADDGVNGVELWALNVPITNEPPSINGTEAGQKVDDNATIDPFTNVTISDPGTVTITVTVTLDDHAKGNLTNLGGFVEGPPGTYTFIGSPTDSTAAIQGMTFVPTPDRVPIGQTETTTFTISADDGIAAPVVDNTTTVIVTAVGPDNTPPSISGTQSRQKVDDNETIKPFTAVTISDPDEDASLVVKIKVEDDDTGELTNLGGFVKVDEETYKFTGTPSDATTSIRGLTFVPKENRLIPGNTEKTTFIIHVDDGIADPVRDDDTSVIVTSINDPPTLIGTIAGQIVGDNDTVKPFGAVNITDPDKKASLTLRVKIDDDDKGELKDLEGFVEGPDGTYTFVGSPSAANSALNGLEFDPEENRLKPGEKETAAFAITVDDGFADPVLDGKTTVIITSINDAPTILGTQADQVVDESDTVDPFTGVDIKDPDEAASLTVIISLDNPASGMLINLNGFVEGPAGIYTFTGSPTESTAAIRTLTFVPTEGRVQPGQSETTTFAISADDGIAEPVVEDNTTVIVRVFVLTKQLFMPLIMR